ncbi:hypothetical protein [Pseudomarimonas arenosa]|uniref:Uncharacterized protein n=1 Tax=Pseudomarimonas arenosa TaxID=2774145 RepID=A0AAW3ZMK7_9GAMM|nr:hypothetical protein [Pseudomarimonas arenosa]MBD8525626.1 hypothetical protein [Pseudomarimonas arenosa]
MIWPPNHSFVPVTISDLSSSDGGAVDVIIDAITQNEPTGASGSGATCPDARGVGSAVAEVRAERAGNRNGRVYSVLFTASNSVGSECSARVDVCVPHQRGGSCEPPAAAHDSTTCN